MTAMRLNELARIGQGQLVGADCEFAGVSTDTRTLQPGALFVALAGPRFDGHDFVGAAAEKKAAAALVARRVEAPIPQVVVADPLAALSDFAREWRRQFSIPVIGVTGSNGKTTTKEMIAAILSRLGPCLVTRGNLNNHIGVPLMLLELNADHRFAVIEMGANHLGEIAHLANIAQPTIGIVTNAGAAHLEGFGSLDGVASGKGELFKALPASGCAIINADDKYANFWRESRSADRVYTFGFEQPADFMAHKVRASGDTNGFRIDFELVTPFGSKPATLNLGGLHNLRNALGAAAAAAAAGATLDELVAGLAEVRAVTGRLELKPAQNGAFIVDDSYNANPSSLKAGLDAFKSLGGDRWLILGDMMELGANADALHAEVGRYAKQAGISRLFAVGQHSHYAVEAFGAGARWFADIDALITETRSALAPGIAVLIKGSRSNRLERVANALAAEAGRGSDGH
ncbi:MAG TPA: UDP-N-acetylmuramoyl-tripeptide--D-alanyl-D-alanine ligase [Steroidobacteraceae bacterium]